MEPGNWELYMGSYITRLWWGGDPDKAESFSGLTLRDIYHVQRTWAPVYAQSETYGMQMFLRLFTKDPNTKTFFKAIRNATERQITSSYQFKAHVKNVMGSINSCVENLNDPRVVAALMNKLGETHYARRIEKIHFEEFQEIWIDVLKKDLKVHEPVLVSWIKFINFIYKHIYESLNGDNS